MVYPKLTPVLHGVFLPAIFREHQVGPADTLVRRPLPDSLQIEHDSRAILTERPHDHPPRYFASPWTN